MSVDEMFEIMVTKDDKLEKIEEMKQRVESNKIVMMALHVQKYVKIDKIMKKLCFKQNTRR